MQYEGRSTHANVKHTHSHTHTHTQQESYQLSFIWGKIQTIPQETAFQISLRVF